MNTLKFFVVFLVLTLCGNLTSSPAKLPANSKIPEDLVITLTRTGCYGGANSCPTYKLTVNADGSVVFEGKDVTKIIGKVEDKISEKKVRQLVDEFNKADYCNLENSYDTENCPATGHDYPSANTSIQINGKRKSVHHYMGCRSKKSQKKFPPQLFELENKIDEIVGAKRWIGERRYRNS